MSSQKPNRVQFPILRREDFATDEGVSAFNLNMAQFVTTINNILGDGGRTHFPAGLDVTGATISGIGEPSSPSDAVSQGHVATNYGAPAIGPQLDVGGSFALTGLTYLFLNRGVISLNDLVGAITLAGDSSLTVTVNAATDTISLHAVGGGGGGNWAWSEQVSGSATSWTLAETPAAAPLIAVMLAGFGGVLLFKGATPGFTIAGKNVTTTTSYTSGSLYAFYPY